MSVKRPLPALQNSNKIANPDFNDIADRNYASTILRYGGLATKFPQLETNAKTLVAAINEINGHGGGSDVTMVDNPDKPNAAVDLTVEGETRTLAKLGYGGRILDNEPPLAEIRNHTRTPISSWDTEIYDATVTSTQTAIYTNIFTQSEENWNKDYIIKLRVSNIAYASRSDNAILGFPSTRLSDYSTYGDKAIVRRGSNPAAIYVRDEYNTRVLFDNVSNTATIDFDIERKDDVIKIVATLDTGETSTVIIGTHVYTTKCDWAPITIGNAYRPTSSESSQYPCPLHLDYFKFLWITDTNHYSMADYDEVQLLRATDDRDLMPKTVAESVYFKDGTKLSEKKFGGTEVKMQDNPNGGVDISVDASTYTVAKQSDLALKADASELTKMVKSVNNNLPDETGNVVIPTGGSTVSVQPITTSGTEIAQITIDGASTSLYAPGGSGGSNVTLSDNVQDGGVDLSVDGTARNLALQSDLKLKADSSKLAEKQDTLIAGANIQIADDGRTISATGGGEKTIVEVNPIYTTGTEIATITVDGTSTSLHAPSGGGGSDVTMVDNINGGVDLTVNSKTETLAKNADVLKYSKDAIGTINVYPIPKICFLTQAQYDSITTKDPDTLYVIKEA